MKQDEMALESAEPKSEPVFRLIYRSRSRIAPEHADRELGDIFRGARANNAARGVTGALLIYEDWFAQTLEGPEAAVLDLFARIKRDTRHDSIQTREQGVAAGRVFSRWAMAKVAEHGDPDIPLVGIAGGVAASSPRKSTDDQERILDLMRDATRGYGRGS